MSKIKVMVYSAQWCAPCKKNKQVLDDNGIDYEYIDIEENNDLCIEYGIRSVPTTIIFESSAKERRIIGVLSQEVINEIKAIQDGCSN